MLQAIENRDVERFFSTVEKTETCWIWKGLIRKDGYGAFFYSPKRQLAHRVAWLIAHGADPGAKYVCHSCDNRRCVRADHLWLGDHAKNMADMAQKGRAFRIDARGERNRQAKLTFKQAEEIRSRYAAGGVTQSQLGREYGVGQWMVSAIVRREHWNYPTPEAQGEIRRPLPPAPEAVPCWREELLTTHLLRREAR